MKKYLSIFLFLILVMSLSACGRSTDNPNTAETAPPPSVSTSESSEETKAPAEATQSSTVDTTASLEEPKASTETEQKIQNEFDELFSFEDLKFTSFYFSSGAGAWRTTLVIQSDGSFTGEYHDSEMGDRGDDNPNGTAYHCEFYGQFTPPEKANDYTYSTQVQEIHYAQEPNTQRIIDGVLYHYTQAYGLQDSERILIYLPGAPLAELPEAYRSWVGYYNIDVAEETELAFYGLYNEAPQYGFSSINIVRQIEDTIAFAEAQELSIDTSLNESTPTQTDYNVAAQRKYELWDGALNALWAVLKQVLDGEAMRQLTNEEMEWIKQKENAVSEAGAGYEGGSLYLSVTYNTAARITKERVYELMELID